MTKIFIFYISFLTASAAFADDPERPLLPDRETVSRRLYLESEEEIYYLYDFVFEHLKPGTDEATNLSYSLAGHLFKLYLIERDEHFKYSLEELRSLHKRIGLSPPAIALVHNEKVLSDPAKIRHWYVDGQLEVKGRISVLIPLERFQRIEIYDTYTAEFKAWFLKEIEPHSKGKN